LREALKLVLPAGVCFNLTVYNEQIQQINTEIIANGGFNNQEVAFIEYLCASQGSMLRCYIIHMYLAVAA
jgi:hypothetical protein